MTSSFFSFIVYYILRQRTKNENYKRPQRSLLQARLPAELLADFKQIIEREERTASQALRLLVRDFVEQHKKQKTIAKQLKGACYGHRRRTKKTTPTQLDLFANNLPHKPYCTDEKGWLQVRKKATAIGKNTYSTTSLALCIGWFMTAITREHLTTLDKPASSSQHRCHEPSQWEQSPVLQTGRPYICTSDHARLKPMQLLAKIDFVMTEQLEADAGYQGFISKNVLHKHWQVQEVNQHAWNLADFLEWIDLPKRLPKRAKTQGLGRNCTMFEQARWWAYSQVLSYRLAGDSGGFHDAVLRYCETINEGFPVP